MTISEVNAQYQAIFDAPNPEMTFHYGWIGCGVFLIFSLAIFTVVYEGDQNKSNDRAILSGLLVCLLVAVAGGALWGAVTSYIRYDDQNKALVIETKQKIEDWKKNVAEPYLNAVPTEKHTLVYMKIDPEIETTVEGISSLGSGYVTSHSELLTPMVISYKTKGQLATYSARFPSTMDLAADGDPYVTLKTLKEPLGMADKEERSGKLCYGSLICLTGYDGAEYEPGAYDYSVHLPKDYTFKEIK